LPSIQNAGSIFIGKWTPESVGDYSAGVNHSLPTYGYARQYSGVNLASFTKHITSSEVTEEGVRNVGPAVVEMARVEGLEAHRRAMVMRMDKVNESAEKGQEMVEKKEEMMAEVALPATAAGRTCQD
jgi:phosphoribosyl-ATP pyrophosphohydrolase / phosphoribosyl-AMP cyclohydrolase / histidinol dehydrogenase